MLDSAGRSVQVLTDKIKEYVESSFPATVADDE